MGSIGSGDNQDAVIDRIVEFMRQRLKAGLTDRPVTMDEIERQAQEISGDLARTIEEELIDEQNGGHVGAKSLCSCGRLARYKGMRARRIVARGGSHDFLRAYYYCNACRDGHYPLDRRLALGDKECTASVLALGVRFCTYLPFRIAASELEAVCGVRLSVSTMERNCVAVGNRLKSAWDEKERLVWERRMRPSEHRPKQLHISMDGAIIFVGGEWREAKLGVVYERKGESVDRARYYATMKNSSAFGKKMRALAQQGGSDRCARMAVVADGGAWIWQETGKYFPASVQILDYFHVTEHLWAVAHLQFGEGTVRASEWMKTQEDALTDDRVHEVIKSVEDWQPKTLAKRDAKRKLLGYLTTHSDRMTYKTFQADNWHIGSGVMESGCKCVVKSRMGGAGMRWSEQGAEAMLHLCAHWRSYDGGDFRQYAN